jgi:small subunit ribosomal protein YMR-31
MPTPITDFKRYRANAQQHGPLARAGHYPSRQNNANRKEAASPSILLDRNDLPARFHRLRFSKEEMDAIDVGFHLIKP